MFPKLKVCVVAEALNERANPNDAEMAREMSLFIMLPLIKK
jgi:hypothetical protein